MVGESSGNPDDWSEWGGYAVVIACDSDEAKEMVLATGPATEISFDRPVVLFTLGVRNPF